VVARLEARDALAYVNDYTGPFVTKHRWRWQWNLSIPDRNVRMANSGGRPFDVNLTSRGSVELHVFDEHWLFVLEK